MEEIIPGRYKYNIMNDKEVKVNFINIQRHYDLATYL